MMRADPALGPVMTRSQARPRDAWPCSSTTGIPSFGPAMWTFSRTPPWSMTDPADRPAAPLGRLVSMVLRLFVRGSGP